jgi:HlyD family secretion protein
MKKLLIVVLLAAGSAGAYTWQANQPTEYTYTTAPVTRGDLVTAVTATGTIEPEELVDVGAQVAGMIQEIGEDPASPGRLIAHGTRVEAGMVLARLDDALFKTRVGQARANLEHAEAERLQAEARCGQADRDLTRLQPLRPSRAVTEQEVDTARSNYEAAQASLAAAASGVSQAKANLNEAVVNLGYTVIRSPVRGVVIDRRVNVGQTVVASLNTPSLFLIARDLSRVQIWASVNEADVNRIRPGQRTRFTLSGLPREEFAGQVAEVRLNASVVSNVVTYTVTVTVDNSSGRFLPYQTARVQFEVDHRPGVLLVPNAALRWTPRPDQAVPEARAELLAALEEAGRAPGCAARSEPELGTLWVAQGNQVRPVRVRVGATDGVRTEITSDDLDPGSAVVIQARERKSGRAGGGLLVPAFDEPASR